MRITQSITIAGLFFFLTFFIPQWGKNSVGECFDQGQTLDFTGHQCVLSVSPNTEKSTQSSWKLQNNDFFTYTISTCCQNQKRIILPLTKYLAFFSPFFQVEKTTCFIPSSLTLYTTGRIVLLKMRILRI